MKLCYNNQQVNSAILSKFSLYDGSAGWRLSPAFDLNPVPADLKPRFLSTAIDLDDNEASIDLALSVATYFALDDDDARATAKDVARSVAEWRHVAADLGLGISAINRMASAFEHSDQRKALKF